MADARSLTARVALATTTLFVVIAAHAVRETARDALFLSDLPATLLPWAYLAIAIGAFGVGAANRWLLGHLSHRKLLVGTLLLGSALDLGFWQIAPTGLPGTSFALYVWTGLLATAATLQLWLHLAAVFDVAEAKRAFPWVLAGGLAGAVMGSVLAAALLYVTDTATLLVASAGLLLVAAWFATRLTATREEVEGLPRAARGAWMSELRESGYLRRIITLAGAIAMLSTGVDYVFKLAVAEQVPPAELAAFFARFHAVVNAASFAFEIVGASWLLRQMGVTRTVALLPALLLAASGVAIAVGAYWSLLALKATDGIMRQSLHGASTEVLYQPLSAQARNVAKTMVESLGKRGGQALASILLLVAVAGGAGRVQILCGLVLLSLLALAAIRGLRHDYVERFRYQLKAFGREARTRVPRLDFYSLEVLVNSLSSPDDAEVVAAIDLLESYGRVRLVSPLLLHHPSPTVVLRALQLFRNVPHPHLDAILVGLLAHEDERVRAAALDVVASRDPHTPHALEMARKDPSAQVRATALVVLAATADDTHGARRLLLHLLEDRTREERVAMARSLPRLPFETAHELAETLLADPDPAAAIALAAALEARPDPRWLPTLIQLLARRGARPSARAALLAIGGTVLPALSEVLVAPDTPREVRRHLPRTIHRFGGARAAEVLVAALPEAEPSVRYKILRALGRMRADDPALALRSEPLLEEAERSLGRAITMLCYRVAFAASTRLDPAPRSAEDDLLEAVLEEKEDRALERVFRVLHILEPEAEFAAIFAALREPGAPVHAIARELLEHMVEGRLRTGMLAFLEDASDLARLRAAREFGAPAEAEALIDALGAGPEPEARDRDALVSAVATLCNGLLADEDRILVSIAGQSSIRRIAATPARISHVG